VTVVVEKDLQVTADKVAERLKLIALEYEK
jgi:hypothetical protein